MAGAIVVYVEVVDWGAGCVDKVFELRKNQQDAFFQLFGVICTVVRCRCANGVRRSIPASNISRSMSNLIFK